MGQVSLRESNPYRQNYLIGNGSSRKKVEDVTRFNDLPDEIILFICCYLTPVHVLKAFSDDDNERLFNCIQEYRQNIDLTKSSYSDLQYFSKILAETALQPATLTLSDDLMPTQLSIFFKRCNSSFKFHPDTIHHLSLSGYTENIIYALPMFLEKFHSLQSLQIFQLISYKNPYCNNECINEICDRSIFNSFTTLTRLDLITVDGIILDKQYHPNDSLTRLYISLHDINDLYILLDGLVPNLRFLSIILCKTNVNKKSLLSSNWPNQSMSHLNEFQLLSRIRVEFTFDQLYHILTPLNQLEKLVLSIGRWHSENNHFINSEQMDMLMTKFPPKLRCFNCTIQTCTDVNMETLARIHERWPMKCHSHSNIKSTHLYTIPYSFDKLYLSPLVNDDANICPMVQTLIVDEISSNVSQRFPNVHTLTIASNCDLSKDDYIAFRHLRHLTIDNINQVPSSVIRRLYSLTLSTIDELVNHSTIYSRVKRLTVKDNKVSSSAILTSLIEHFPDLRVLEIPIELNADYYDNLNLLLDENHLPHLSTLKTSWIGTHEYFLNINLWLKSNTRLKWRSVPFSGHYDQNHLTISR